MTSSMTAFRILVDEQSQVGEARRKCAELVQLWGLGTEQAGRAAIIVSELATNLVKHAVHGEIILQAGPNALHVYSLDRGPGIPDMTKSSNDGYSTAGTSGNGLGAVRRLSDSFETYSSEKGTVTCAAVTKSKLAKLDSEVGAICVSHPHETECGDGWCLKRTGDCLEGVVVDGLGHGPLAAKAAQTAVECFKKHGGMQPTEHIHNCDSEMQGGRGAAAAFVSIDQTQAKMTYGGLGNISASLVQMDKTKGLVSFNGILGGSNRKVGQFECSWSGPTLLVMHTDGIKDRWSLSDYPGLFFRHPSLIAGVLFRDFSRATDDSTIVVIRLESGEAA